MSLAGALTQVVDDIVDAAAPLAARFAAPRRVAVAEGDALAIYDAPRGDAPPRRLDAATAKRGAKLAGELRLPAGAVLMRNLSFPAATRDYLEPVLDNRLERLTPWSPDRVVYGYRTEDAGDGQISVNLAATSREVAELWVARAEALGFTPTAIGSAADPLDAPLKIDLWRGRRDPFRAQARRGLALAGLVAGAILLPLTAWSFWALHASEQKIAGLEARSAAARAVIARASGGGARETALLGEKRPEAAMMTLIDRLSTALPDGAVLRDLEIDPERVRLAGVSDAAPELIGLLQASGAIADARFGAPVTRNAEGRDGFEILARRIAPPAGEPRP